MNIEGTIQPDSTQVNADDLIAHPITVTVASVSAGTTEQPVNIHLVEMPDRAYRPGKSMRRVLVSAWGANADDYVGRRMTLYCDPSIKFGPSVTGGVRISHLSHIDKPMTIPLTVTRGKRAPFTVQPLPAAPPTTDPTPAQIAAATSPDELMALWERSSKSPETRALITARKAELDGGAS